MKTQTALVTVHEPDEHIIDRIMACAGDGKLSKMTPLEKMFFMQGAIQYKHQHTSLDFLKEAMEEAYPKLTKMIKNKMYGPGDVTKEHMLFLNDLFTNLFDGSVEEAYDCFKRTHR